MYSLQVTRLESILRAVRRIQLEGNALECGSGAAAFFCGQVSVTKSMAKAVAGVPRSKALTFGLRDAGSGAAASNVSGGGR